MLGFVFIGILAALISVTAVLSLGDHGWVAGVAGAFLTPVLFHLNSAAAWAFVATIGVIFFSGPALLRRLARY